MLTLFATRSFGIIDMQINNWYKIIDKKTSKILCAGEVCNCKSKVFTPVSKARDFNCISFDNKYFFKVTDENQYLILPNLDKICVPLDFTTIPVTYEICLWRDAKNNLKADIYREYDIIELDTEVISLVAAINDFEDVNTVGSCSGHNKDPLWIDIKFYSMSFLRILLTILEKSPFNFNFRLCTSPTIINNDKSGIILQLRSEQIGLEAYRATIQLADRLKEVNVLLGQNK